MCRRDGGPPAAPSTFVAAKSSRDAAQRLPAQAVTSVALRSTAPVWNQLLSVGERTTGTRAWLARCQFAISHRLVSKQARMR